MFALLQPVAVAVHLRDVDLKVQLRAGLGERHEAKLFVWKVYMVGGFGAYYYTYTAWDVIRPRDTPPGYEYFKHLQEFLQPRITGG